ncbi:Bug family tripartite tricarboxylate transporter substrate binding protein [Roseomonas sp. BN140053]|uniref:Bug family tripartite tricarboxylate transporter substrate binding protein n=1 Tax=Roseomonas sp. BN140053 TaxID=3391898 RepID=UPI0039E9664C
MSAQQPGGATPPNPTAAGRLSRRTALALPALLLAGRAWAQGGWPNQPIRIVSAGSPGGSTDVMARLLSEGLAARLGRPFPVDSRPGAEGVLSAQAFVQSPPGTALYFTNTGTITTTPLLFDRMTYDTWTDLVPIAPVGTDFLAYAVHTDFPAQSLGEVFDRVREKPGQYSWCSAPGATYLLTLAHLKRNNLDMSFISYRTTGQAATDTAAGRVNLTVQPLTTTLGPLAEDGKLRVLATTAEVAPPGYPAMPTVRSLGMPDLEVAGFPGLFGWKGMPDELRDRLSVMVQEIVDTPEVQERFRTLGMLKRPSTPASFHKDLRDLHERLADIARTYGARPPA